VPAQAPEGRRTTWIGDGDFREGARGSRAGADEVDTRDQFDAQDLVPLFGLAGTTAVGNYYRQETTTKALFAHVERQISDSFRLNAGLRYTDDRELRNAFTFMVTLDTMTGGGFLCALRPLGEPRVGPVLDGVETG